ncbi:MAG: hypothetical protein IPN44_11160 [Flavobacteriales bacterium]|nr:hypothetical protein [Flavobacteriales bacterium]
MGSLRALRAIAPGYFRSHFLGAALLCAAAGLFTPVAMAQDANSIRVSAKLDTASILIGEQAHLLLSVDYRVDQGGSTTIIWPTIGDTITGKVPVLLDSHVDTILPEKNADPYHFRQQRTLTITSWDSGYWAIPPFRFISGADTLATDPLLLTVNTVPVDTTKAIRPIKGIYTVPFSFADWLRDNWPWLAGGLALLSAIIALVIYVKRRKPKGKEVAPPPPPVPAHLLALRALEELRAQKLCEQGLVKAHCAGLADILRAYIEKRFRVPAMEQTTDELMGALRISALSKDKQTELRNILQLADLAKFAKWKPSLPETDQMLATAMAFVQQTADQHTDAPLP